MRKINFKVLIIITVVSAFMSSCNKSKNPVLKIAETEVIPEDIVEMREDQVKLANVELGSVEMHSIGNTLRVNGIVSVAPQNLATVCMPMGGFIKNTNLLPGNAVNKGQTLAVIENQEFIDIQQNYLEAKNRLVYAKAEFERHTKLFKDDVYSEQNVQQVTTEYRNLLALVKSLEQKLLIIGIDPDQLKEENISSSVNLISPIKGYLKTVNINIGKYVSPTDVLFEIVNGDKLFLELTLFEKDVQNVKPGQRIRFLVNDCNDEHEAVITQTGKSISNDKTFKIFASVTGHCEKVLPGMYVNANIEESNNEVTVLPSEAIVTFNDKDYIFLFDKNKEEAGKPFTEYKIVEIKKGISSAGFTEIILPGSFDIKTAKVVVKGAYNLLSAKKNAGEMAC